MLEKLSETQVGESDISTFHTCSSNTGSTCNGISSQRIDQLENELMELKTANQEIQQPLGCQPPDE